MKIGKWILGLLAGIGGLLAIILGMKNGQSKRQFNKAVKDNKKKEKDIIKKEGALKDKNKKIGKKIKKTNTEIKDLKTKRSNVKKNTKKFTDADEADKFLRNLNKEKKNG